MNNGSNHKKEVADMEVLAVCDGCGRNIMANEQAWLRYGIHCYDCCKIIWEHGIEFLETSANKNNQHG